MGFQTDTTNAGLSLALGVQEVRPVDLVPPTARSPTSGRAIGHTTILTVKDAAGNDVVDPYVPPAGVQVVSPQAAYIVTDILNGNTIRSVNPFWGRFAITGPDGRRPATLKTGTNNDAKDLNAYGYIAPPTKAGREAGAYALVVGRLERQQRQHLGLDGERSAVLHRRHDLRLAGLHERGDGQVAGDELQATGRRPDQGRHRPVDRVARRPGPGRRSTSGSSSAPSRQNRLAPDTCGVDVLAVAGIERGHETWLEADRGLDPPSRARARRRRRPRPHPDELLLQQRVQAVRIVVGRARREGPPAAASPARRRPATSIPTPDPSGVIPSFEIPSPSASGEVAALPCPTPSPLPSESPSASRRSSRRHRRRRRRRLRPRNRPRPPRRPRRPNRHRPRRPRRRPDVGGSGRSGFR